MRETKKGLFYGLSAYLIWGAFPIYFGLLITVNPLEIVPWRVFMTLAFCAILLTLMRRWPLVLQLLRRPRTLFWIVLSALAVYANWQIYVIGVVTGHVIETALGYFINPLFTILLGVLIWRERLTRLQWVAVSIAAVGVLFAALGYGSFPWVALGLTFSFGLYGALRKKAGSGIDGVTALAVETMVTTPLAVVQLLVVTSIAGMTAFSQGPGIGILVLLGGLMTGIPLILFGESTRRLPLSYIGFLQFLTPITGFLYGYFVLHEEMSTGRWAGFIGVWIALVILIIDMILQLRRTPGVTLNTAPIPLD